jgi:hypothetical protein
LELLEAYSLFGMAAYLMATLFILIPMLLQSNFLAGWIIKAVTSQIFMGHQGPPISMPSSPGS